MRSWSRLLLVVFLLSSLIAIVHAQSNPPDLNLATSYSLSSDYKTLNWIVSGYLPGSSGAYAAGSFGPFGRVGGVLEGEATVSGTTVYRYIFVLDVAAGTTGKGVVLYEYRKTDVITSSTYDSVTMKLLQRIVLPLTGGVGGHYSMAANNKVVVVGSSNNSYAVSVTKGVLSYTTIGGFVPPINVSAVTANKYGSITISFGGFGSGSSGFIQLNANGGFSGDGGGNEFLANTRNAVMTEDLPATLSSEPKPEE